MTTVALPHKHTWPLRLHQVDALDAALCRQMRQFPLAKLYPMETMVGSKSRSQYPRGNWM